ncbi:MAG: hypothetical protein Q7N50_13170 [Armatimonadota bacterium]|nr:hypothetical protein [Armatimonadota bacterium]
MDSNQVTLTVGLAGVVGVLIGTLLGAVVNYWCTKKAEAWRNLENFRTQAYLDYMKTVANLANVKTNVKSESISEHEREQREFELDAEQLDAKARVFLYGTLDVIHALAELQKTDLDLEKPENRAVFCQMLCGMRRSYVTLGIIDRVKYFCRKPPLLADEIEWILSGKEDNIKH